MKKWLYVPPVIFLVLIAVPALLPIVTPGYFPMHDDTQVVRVFEMRRALQSGQFPVRWVPDLGYGYGYPIFNFYNPLPYYFGSLFQFLGMDALFAAKMMFIFPIILSGLTMYLFSKLLLPRWGALLASTLYIYAPYHAVQIYVRGAVAEYWAYAILPLVFYAIWKRKVVSASLALAALITSHNLTAFMSIPFVALLILIKFFEVKNKSLFTVYCFLFTALALGVSAFFWLPAIVEAGKTQVSQMVFEKFDPPAKHLITPNQLWSSPWGYGGSSPRTDDGLSLQLGKVHLLGSLAAIALLLHCYIVKKTMKQCNNVTIFFAVGLLFSVFMVLPLSQPIWNSLPILSYIQFPWRFLTFASLFSSILAAWAILLLTQFFGRTLNFRFRENSAGTPEPRTRALATHGWKPWEQVSVVLGLSFLFIFFSIKFFQPQFKYLTSAAQLTSRERMLWEVSRRSDEYLPIGFIRPATLEQALRVDNPINQTLADELKKPTPVRRLGNIISVITIISMIGYTLSRHPERRDV